MIPANHKHDNGVLNRNCNLKVNVPWLQDWFFHIKYQHLPGRQDIGTTRRREIFRAHEEGASLIP